MDGQQRIGVIDSRGTPAFSRPSRLNRAWGSKHYPDPRDSPDTYHDPTCTQTANENAVAETNQVPLGATTG
jgi:hypothetical protein